MDALQLLHLNVYAIGPRMNSLVSEVSIKTKTLPKKYWQFYMKVKGTQLSDAADVIMKVKGTQLSDAADVRII